jgi:hypothetical protein
MLKAEPAVVAGLIRLVVVLASAFAVELSAEQFAGLYAATEGISTILTRGAVTPVAKG